jgi:hypothetical protein
MRGALVKFVWGAAYANTLTVEFPLDDARAYTRPRDGSEMRQWTSGVEDAWLTGLDGYLDGVVRFIPGTTTGSATGWDGATGWDEFLRWCWAKNVPRFYPDRVAAPSTFRTVYLVAPDGTTDPTEREADFTRRLRLSLRATDGLAFPNY